MRHMIEYYRKTLNIKRIQGTHLHRNYNLAEHQYGVGMLFRHFCRCEDIPYDLEVYDAVLHHDIVEVETTDLLWHIKNQNEATKAAWAIIENEVVNKHFPLKPFSDESLKKTMNSIQHKMFKVCDYLELWLFCKEEVRLGNKNPEILIIIDNCEGMILGRFEFVDLFIEEYNAGTGMVRKK